MWKFVWKENVGHCLRWRNYMRHDAACASLNNCFWQSGNDGPLLRDVHTNTASLVSMGDVL